MTHDERKQAIRVINQAVATVLDECKPTYEEFADILVAAVKMECSRAVAVQFMDFSKMPILVKTQKMMW